MRKYRSYPTASGKSDTVELVLCLTLGCFGAHHFYKGNRFTGLLYTFTLGFVGIGPLLDAIEIVLRIAGRNKKTGR